MVQDIPSELLGRAKTFESKLAALHLPFPMFLLPKIYHSGMFYANP